MGETKILAYTAGLFDGEGCVAVSKSLDKKSNKFKLHINVSIGSTNKDVLEFLLKEFGGKITMPIEGGLGKKTFWHWQMQGYKSKEFLNSIEPYLIIKKKQAHLAISFYKTKVTSRHGMTEEIRKSREGIYEEIRFLNSGYMKGVN